MPDLTAGSRLLALDTPPAVGDTQDDLYTFTTTSFGVTTTGGTYNDCAVVFVAPTTGRVMIGYAAELDNGNATASTNVAPHVREGGTIGSGSDVLPAALATAVRNVGTDARRFGASLLLEGLTAGDEYNVRLEHRVSGDTGTVQYRRLHVLPAP